MLWTGRRTCSIVKPETCGKQLLENEVYTWDIIYIIQSSYRPIQYIGY